MRPIIFGHRGVPSQAPENSLKSFELLLEYNIPGVELDIHLTSDGELAVIHDFNTLSRTGEDYLVAKTPYSILKTLDIGEGERIPTLRDVFNLLKGRVYYDLEIKTPSGNRRVLVKKVLELILEYNLSHTVFISSFDPLVLVEFNRVQKKYNQNIKTAIIYSRHKDVPLFLRNGLGFYFTKNSIVKPHYKQLKGLNYFIFTRLLKKTCYTWTVNSKEDYNLAVKRGALGICTNIPQHIHN